MNKWKRIFLGTAIVGIITVCLGIAGTYSWFTSETTAKGTLVNGTLSLGEMESLFEHEQFAPSQLLYSEWQTIDNTGDLDQLLRATYTHEINSENGNIDNFIVGYTALKYTKKPDEDELNDQKYELEKLLEGTTNPISPFSGDGERISGILTDKQTNTLSDDTTSESLTLGDASEFWSLDDDEYIDIVFGVKLDETAGNELQGAQYNATFKVEAKQTDNGAAYQNE